MIRSATTAMDSSEWSDAFSPRWLRAFYQQRLFPARGKARRFTYIYQRDAKRIASLTH